MNNTFNSQPTTPATIPTYRIVVNGVIRPGGFMRIEHAAQFAEAIFWRTDAVVQVIDAAGTVLYWCAPGDRP